MSHRRLEAQLITVPAERRIAKRRNYRNLFLVTPNRELSCETVKCHSIDHKSVMSALGHKQPVDSLTGERLDSAKSRRSVAGDRQYYFFENSGKRPVAA